MKTLLTCTACLLLGWFQMAAADGTNQVSATSTSTVTSVGKPYSGGGPCKPAGKTLRELVLSCHILREHASNGDTLGWAFGASGVFGLHACLSCPRWIWKGQGIWKETPEGYIQLDGKWGDPSSGDGEPLHLTITAADVYEVTNRNGSLMFPDYRVRFTYSTKSK